MVTTEIPTLSSIHPEWRALSDKLYALSVREDAIANERREIEREQGRRNAVHFTEPSVDIVGPAPKRKALSAAARALLGATAPAPEPDQPPAERVYVHNGWGNADLARLGTEYAVIQEAKAAIHPLLTAAKEEGSRKLCEVRLPEYRVVAARLAAALIELGDAMLAHDALTADMIQQGASWSDWRPVDIATLKTAIGEPGNRYSRLRVLLNGTAEGGHIQATGWAHWNTANDPTVATNDAPAAVSDKAKAPGDWKAGMREALASTNRSLARLERPAGQ